MTRAALLPALLAAALPGSAGWAQQAQDKVRLDDFTLPRAPAVAVEQIGPRHDGLPGPQVRDRSLAVPAPPAVARRALPQVTAREGARSVAQLAPQQRSSAAAPALSARADSRPQGASAIVGIDRCDPQRRAERVRDQCRRILELRAGEFEAPEAPVLSAEQRLLIDQQFRERRLSPLRDTPGRMVRSADQPDDPGTQELATVVLAPTSPPVSAADQSPATIEASLAARIQGIILGLQVTPAR